MKSGCTKKREKDKDSDKDQEVENEETMVSESGKAVQKENIGIPGKISPF